MDWPAATLSIATVIISSGSALLGSYLTLRSQNNIKKTELQSQATIKGKEFLLNIYQKRIELINRGMDDFGKGIDRLLAEVKELESKHGDKAAVIPALIMVQSSYEIWRDDYFHLKQELEEYQLVNRWKNQLAMLDKFFALSPDQITIQNIGTIYLDFARAAATTTLMYNSLLFRKSEELFSEHIKAIPAKRS